MAKHKSNGHATKELSRAPKGGVRVRGRYYKGGSILPANGRPSLDPATGVPLAPPNFGRLPMPHAMTFIGKQSLIAQIYRNPDEAVRRSSDSWKMRRDPSIMECLEARQRGTALLNWHLEVEDEKDPRQKELQTELTKVLKRTVQFTEYRRNLLEALWYGRYAVMHQYGFETIGGKRRAVIKGWRPINGDKLAFRFDDGSGRYSDDEVGIRVTPLYGQKDILNADEEPTIMTDQGMVRMLSSWKRRLVAIHKHIIEDGDYEDPISAGRVHGVGIRDRIYWCWFQKQETMAQMMEVIDRTGSGITIYWYPAGDNAAKSEVEEMAQEQKHENILVMPRMSGDPATDAYGIERIEPSAGGVEIMRGVIDEFFGNQIMRYINGGTLYSKSESLGIGGGGADFQERSFHQIIAYDAVKLEETITTETVLPLKDFNFPWARDISVLFRIDTDSPDSEEKLSAAEKLWNMGAKIKTKQLMDLLGLSIVNDGEEYLQNPQFAQQQPGMMQDGAPGADGQPQDEMQHLFGPLAGVIGHGGADNQGGAGNGGEPGPDDEPPGFTGGPARFQKSDWREHLKQAIQDTERQPSDEQKEAGNYRKGKLNWNGLTISLENVAGSRRRPEWEPLAHHYGYINRTEGKDGDHVDCFLGPDLGSDMVYVVDQEFPVGNHFDEHKCLLGFHNVDEARAAYLDNYEPDWHVGPITAMTVDQFKAWLDDGDTTARVAGQVARYAKRSLKSSAGQASLWKEELHPREKEGTPEGGQFSEKQQTFSDLASKLGHIEGIDDSPKAQAAVEEIYQHLAGADLPPGQLHALLSGDDQRLAHLKAHSETEEEVPYLPEIEAGRREALAGIRAGALLRAQGTEYKDSDVRLVGRHLAPASETPPTSSQGTDSATSEGMPGESSPGDDEGGFALSPETSKGHQENFWHGMGDKPGQEKLFEGLDLAGK